MVFRKAFQHGEGVKLVRLPLIAMEGCARLFVAWECRQEVRWLLLLACQRELHISRRRLDAILDDVQTPLHARTGLAAPFKSPDVSLDLFRRRSVTISGVLDGCGGSGIDAVRHEICHMCKAEGVLEVPHKSLDAVCGISARSTMLWLCREWPVEKYLSRVIE